MTYLYQSDLNLNTEYLSETISEIDPKLYEIKPTEESWSLSQVCEHLLILEKSILFLFNGEQKETDRSPGEMIENIKDKVLDFTIKATAPKSIAPKGLNLSIEEILNGISENRKLLIENLESSEPNSLCLAYEHFYFGKMTKVEWIYFIIYHAERHLHQINKIVIRQLLPLQ